jgi:hypothetical protein
MGLFWAVGGLLTGTGVPVWAQQVIYNDSTNDLVTRFNPGTYQVGNEIILAGDARYLTTFSFEFFGTNTASLTSFSQPITCTLTFYQMNPSVLYNGYPTPGTSFFSESFSVPSPTDRSTFVFTAGVDFPSGGLFIPTSDMTWTVQFEGMGATDTVGVDLYFPATVGQNYGDYWQNDGTLLSPSWVLLTNTVPMGFGAYMEAVPEPSNFVLPLAGGLGILSLVRRLRRKE